MHTDRETDRQSTCNISSNRHNLHTACRRCGLTIIIASQSQITNFTRWCATDNEYFRPLLLDKIWLESRLVVFCRHRGIV